MPKIKVVTSFGPGGYESYARDFIKTFIEHWPGEVDLEVCYHDQEFDPTWPQSDAPKVTYRNLNEDGAHQAFYEKIKDLKENKPYVWQRDVQKFSHKVYAILGTTLTDYDWLIWLDADIQTFRKFPREALGEWLQSSDFVYLERTIANYPESSFMAFNLGSTRTISFLNDFKGIYDGGEVLSYMEWHDGFVIGRLLQLYKQHGLLVHSLTRLQHRLNSFEASSLADYMVHFKGMQKDFHYDAPGQRYHLFNDLLKIYQPSVVAETGTWNGDQAIHLAQEALKYKQSFHYIGFDLFEDGTPELDAIELNTKPHFHELAVRTRLDAFKKSLPLEKNFTYELFKGDTKESMKKASLDGVEFAYIDGGHSHATVENDFQHLKHVPIIVFDDFFDKDENGKIPADLGVNEFFAAHPELTFIDLPAVDRVAGGGLTKFRLVRMDDKKVLPEFVRPLKVNPVNCVPDNSLLENVKAALPRFREWLVQAKVHDGTAIIVSGGPSINNPAIQRQIRDLAMKGGVVFTIKHSYNTMLDAGIIPYGCVVLDPRPVGEKSTHGVIRTKLLERPHPDTRFFVATMSAPPTIDFILKSGARVVGWNAFCNGVSNVVHLPPPLEWITGGTCAAFRTISIAHYLGFRKMHLFGFDLCIDPTKVDVTVVEDGKPKYLSVKIGSKQKDFISTGELISAAQDFQKLVENLHNYGIDMNVYGEGICPTLWEDMKPRALPNWDNLFHVEGPTTEFIVNAASEVMPTAS